MLKSFCCFLVLAAVASSYGAEPFDLGIDKKLWEPWVDEAVVGDKMVRYHPEGIVYREYLEVTALDDSSITVTVKTVYDKKVRPDLRDTVQRLVYSRENHPVLQRYYKACKLTGKDSLVVKNEKFPCEIKDRGFLMGYARYKDEHKDDLKIERDVYCREWIKDGVPFGGALRQEWFFDPKVVPGFGTAVKVGKPRLQYVVEEFSRGSAVSEK